MQKRESCLKEGAGWVEMVGGGFPEVNFEKNVLIRERERERERQMRERVRVGVCVQRQSDVIRKNGSF